MPHIALVVRDYDEALAFYVGKLAFELVEDTCIPEQDKRWVTIRPTADHDYGRVAVWRDLYGNLWNLVESPPHSRRRNAEPLATACDPGLTPPHAASHSRAYT